MKVKKLSAYTHARNCTDIADCEFGISEIWEAVKRRERGDYGETTVPCYYFVRLNKLHEKKEKYEKRAIKNHNH
jgi:hypothetical protein